MHRKLALEDVLLFFLVFVLVGEAFVGEELVDVSLDINCFFVILVRKLGPNFNSEEVFLTNQRLVKQPDSANLVDLRELACDNGEDEPFPNFLDQREGRFEVPPELATLRANDVLPLGLYVPLKEGEAVDALCLTVDVVELHGLQLIVVEEILDLTVWNIAPGLREAEHIVEPRNLAQRFLVVLYVVVLPDDPVGLELELLLDRLLEYNFLLLVRALSCTISKRKSLPSAGVTLVSVCLSAGAVSVIFNN